MKSVLFFINDLKGGGAERVLVNLVNHMDRNEYNITVLTLFDEGVNKQYLNENIKYRSILKKSFRGNSYLFKILSPDILYRMFIRDYYDILAAYLEGTVTRIISGCKNPDTKKVAWVHSTASSSKGFFQAFKSKKEIEVCYKKLDAIVGVSKTVIDSFMEETGIEAQYHVKYNTVDSNIIKQQSLEAIEDLKFLQDEINVCSVGRLNKQKGYERLLNIHKRLHNDGIKVHLYLLGQGELKPKLEEFIEENELQNSISLLGYKQNPYKYVKSCDLFVCPSYMEGFSTAVTEALIVGTPVITTLCSGMEEMLENGKYGLIVDNSEEALYEGMKQMLTNPDKLKHYKKMADERGTYFDTKSTVKSVEELFNKLLGEE